MNRRLHAGRSPLATIPLAGPLLQRVGRFEGLTLAAVVATAFAIAGFGLLAGEVVEGDTARFDRAVLLALRSAADPDDPLGPVWFEEVMRDFTALGGNAVLIMVTLAAAGFLLMIRKGYAALVVIASIVGGVLLSQALKWGFDRPRPDLVPHGAEVYTQSFPSGHAMLSAVVYLTLGALLARTQPDRRVKVYLLTVAGLITLVVGSSRVYLGVHWPTDVLAGWALGAAWALLCWLAMLWLQRGGQVETDRSSTVVDTPSNV